MIEKRNESTLTDEAYDNQIRAMSHKDGVADIQADPARQRLREHILGRLEAEGATRFSDWKNLSEQEKLESLQTVTNNESAIHMDRGIPPSVRTMRDDGQTLGATTRSGGAIHVNEEQLRSGTASQNLNTIYHENKHIDQISADVSASVRGAKPEPGSKEQVTREELNLSREAYLRRYHALAIEAEARAAGRIGEKAADKVLSDKENVASASK